MMNLYVVFEILECYGSHCRTVGLGLSAEPTVTSHETRINGTLLSK